MMKVDPASVPRDEAPNGGAIIYWSMAGGITQFGAYTDRLMPGATSSQRHWHSAEDEFLYVLDGTITVIDDDGAHDLHPGDAACFRHGDPNAHHVTNRSGQPATYIIVGTRVAGDICTYPDEAERQVNSATTWAIETDDGDVIEGGDLPPHLLNLPPVWGTLFNPAILALRILSAAKGTLPAFTQADADLHPILGPGPGPYAYQLLSDPGHLSQFGCFIEELPPGSRSGHRHWHEAEDEMVYILSGAGILVEDTESLLSPGDVACWPKGTPTAHRIDNRGDQPLRYLVIGTRLTQDVIHYADHDLVTLKDGPARTYLHRDGRPYPPKGAA
jgi:uncharacterized cupin superfamily protein